MNAIEKAGWPIPDLYQKEPSEYPWSSENMVGSLPIWEESGPSIEPSVVQRQGEEHRQLIANRLNQLAEDVYGQIAHGSLAAPVKQVAHGLSVNEAVYRNSSGVFVKAIATAQETLAQGWVKKVIGVNEFEVYIAPALVNWTHSQSLNVPLYLSTSVAGATTSTKPSPGSWRQEILWTQTAGTALWRPAFGFLA